jgi:hypothetical protein
MEGARSGALVAVVLWVMIAVSACGPGGAETTGPPPVITMAGAQKVLTQYMVGSNHANQLRDSSVLAGVEAGSSYQIDSGTYTFNRVADPSNQNYSELSFVQPTFFIPHQTGYPAWFAVRAHQQPVPPKSGSSNADLYLLFTRASASAKWLEVLDPYVLSGAGPAPRVTTDSHGNALQVAPADAGRLALAPDRLPAADVDYLNAGTGLAQPLRPGLPTPKPANSAVTFASGKTNLGVLHDQAFFEGLDAQGQLLVQVLHATTSDPVYALRTADGGALVFYDLSATMTISTIYGQLFSVKYSGFISGSEQDAAFQVNYSEEFAVYEPAGAQAAPQVVAEVSGPVSANCGGGPC